MMEVVKKPLTSGENSEGEKAVDGSAQPGSRPSWMTLKKLLNLAVSPFSSVRYEIGLDLQCNMLLSPVP